MSNTNTEVLTTAYEKLQGAITQSDTVLSNLQEAIENADLSNYATTSDLEEKANKDSVFTMANMGQDIKEAMTGGSVAVIGENMVLTQNIVDKQVTPVKTSFFNRDINNLYDYLTVSKGYIDGTTGVVTTTETNYTTDYIEVEQNTYYYMNDIDGMTINYALFDENKTYINGYNNALTTSFNNTHIPTTSKYIRISFKKSQCDIYDFIFSKTQIKQNFYLNNNYIKKEALTSDDISFLFTHGKNLFDKDNITNNVVIDNNNSGNEYSINGFCASEYIDIIPNKKYLLNTTKCNFAFYTEDKTYISGTNSTALNAYAPSNAKYIRFSFNTTDFDINNVMLEENSTGVSSEYEEYKKVIKESILPKQSIDSIWKGKKWCSYGDSITEMNMWQNYVTDYFVFSQHYNRGIGGTCVKEIGSTAFINSDGSLNATDIGQTQPEGTTKIKSSFCNTERINAMIPVDVDLVVIMGGTNDMGRAITSDNPQPSPIGDTTYDDVAGDFDVTTFKGGLASTIIKIKNRVPNAKIIVASPVGGRGEQAGVNMTKQVVNKLGLTTQDYANAVKEVCEELSVFYAPVFEESGINQFNRATYISDTVHPNALGGKLLANVFINTIEKIKII